MVYFEVKFKCTPNNEIITDILSAYLGEIGFDSFVTNNEGLDAYIPSKLFNEDEIKNILAELPIEANISYTYAQMEDKDWNEEWEKNFFQPLIIDDLCSVQSTFHKVENNCKYKIFIDPKMAFGTGHHQTTELMMREILEADFQGKSVLDMGCGTAILAILASMRGANPITAIDIDEWAYDNAIENLNLNNVSNIKVEIGGADLLGKETFDVILANINRNILLNDIKTYISVLNTGGFLYMSGFYTEDIPAIQAECEKHGLKFCNNKVKDNWTAVKFEKIV